MYLHSLTLKNFRCFGEPHTIFFNKGLNVLVGENDSGKSAIIDAIRIVLGTTDQSWYHIELTDFYNENRDLEIKIVLRFDNLTDIEKAAFLECLSYTGAGGENTPVLYVHWSCRYLLSFTPPRTMVTYFTGVDGNGCPLPVEAKEFLRVTYLRPLRDSFNNMQSGRNSRLSQIMQGIPDLNQGKSEYLPDMDLAELSITGIADLSNRLLAEHPKLKAANNDINTILTSKMLLKGDMVQTQFEVAGNSLVENRKLAALLEKLDLTAYSRKSSGRVGLGTSNVLSMACELLLNRNAGSSFLLIEEPEAHIHAQRQLRLIQSLQSEANAANRNQQIIVTTHSPILASVVSLGNVTIIKAAKAYSLEFKFTRLDKSDYVFLERYLDATKANLFFAKSIIMVEGPSEELLLPTIAKLLGKDLTEYGISLVNVRGTGLRRFARIFQRQDDSQQIDVKVACITDRDIMPDCAPAICLEPEYSDKSKWPKDRNWRVESDYPEQSDKENYLQDIKKRADGQQVKTFVSEQWTFEYDLFYSGLTDELIEAVVNIKYIEQNRNSQKARIHAAISQFETLAEKASFFYRFFAQGTVSKAEVAQELAIILENKYRSERKSLLSKLPSYIKDAINYVT